MRFDEDIRCLFLLLDGRAKIYLVHENGKRALIQFLGKNNFIGELSLIEAEEHSKDVVAINDCTCLAIPLASAKKQLLEDNAFLLHLSKYLFLRDLPYNTLMLDNKKSLELLSYINTPMSRDSIVVLHTAHNIKYEKCELFNDFVQSLIYLIFDIKLKHLIKSIISK